MCDYEVTTPEERADVANVLQTSSDSEGFSTPWIKTESLGIDNYFSRDSLLWRSDIQSLALGVLTMDWSPRGHLSDKSRGGFFLGIIRPASDSLEALLEATCRFCESTTTTSLDHVGLVKSAKKMLPLISSRSTTKFSRDRHEALYNLEQALNQNFNIGLPSRAVGVMFITSKTFRNFVQASVRDSNENILSLNQVSKSLVITEQGDFSNMLFALDYEKVFGEAAPPIPTFLTFKTVLFAALQACVRSTVFSSSFDSMDLLRSIKRMDDLVYVSAISSKWRHQSPHLEARDSVIPTESSSDEPS